jgi:hypothetical protein
MAEFKEFKVKVVVDTGEANKAVETTINTLSGFETQIGKLSAKLKTTPVGTKEFKELSNELSRTEKAFGNAQNSGKSWLQSMASAPGIIGSLGQSIQGAGKLFSSFDMALKTSLIGFIAGLVAKLVDKFSQMEGVMDPLNKVTSIFSAVMGKLAEFILPPIAAILDGIASAAEGVANFFGKLMGDSGDLGDELGDLADRQDALNDSQAEYELGLSKTSRALAEAREAAADGTKSVKERKEALQNADKIERQIAAEGKARALEAARIKAGELAASLGATAQQIANIKKYDAAQLESYAAEIKQRKGLNAEQRNALLAQLGQIQEIDANTAKIGKKTAAAIEGINNEVAAKAKEAASKALEAQKNKLNAQIELEKNKANTDEKILTDLLKKKDELENKGTKKSAEELELQQQNRDKAIKDALKADTDASEAKTKKDKEEQQKRDDEYIKGVKQKDTNELTSAEILLEEKKRIYGAESQEVKTQQEVIYAAKQKAIKDEIDAIGLKKEQTEADKQRLIELGNENLKLTNIILAGKKAETDAIKKKAEDELAATFKLETDKLELELAAEQTTYDRKVEILDRENQLLEADYQKKLLLAGDDAIKKGNIELEYTKKRGELGKKREEIDNKEYENKIKIAQGTANMLSAMADLVGKDTLAGKALGISAALINTYVGASEAIKQKSTLPSPFDVVAKVINVATVIATGLKTVQAITAVQVPDADVPEVRIRKAMGGILQGPTHANGGIATPFGELEGGEYVVNRASTQMFRPQLEAINTQGGGQRDYNYSGFGGNIMGGGEPPIFKTYVVASDMSNQQEMDRVIKDRSKI